MKTIARFKKINEYIEALKKAPLPMKDWCDFVLNYSGTYKSFYKNPIDFKDLEALQFKENNQKLQNLQSQISDMTRELNNYEMKMQNLSTINERLCQASKEKDNKIETIQSQLTRIKQKMQNYEKQLHKLSSENENLIQISNQKDFEIRQLKSQLLNQTKSSKIETTTNNRTTRSFTSVERTNSIKILDSKTISDFTTIKIIGNGGYGTVYEVTYNNKTYAHKVLTSITIDNFKIMMNEYELLHFLDHPNVLKTYGIFMSDENLPPSILLEHCCQDIGKVIKEKTLSKVRINFIIYQIVEAMKYIHFKKIIHRDLKPTNILIDKNGTVKICDFGISKYVDPDDFHSSMTKCLGTLFFMAPEILNESDHYDEKIDIYSFGVLIYFIINGEMPNITIPQICAGKKAHIPTTMNRLSRNLINSCWNFDPAKRPSFKQIFNELGKYHFLLVDLSEKEMNDLKYLINQHKTRIPRYD